MKKIIKLIIVVMIFIILLATILIIINNKQIEYKQEERDNYVIDDDEKIESQISDVVDPTMFFTIENCVQKYLDNSIINIKSGDRIDLNYEYTDPELRKTAVYKLLTENYIKENNITNQNVLKYTFNIEEQVVFTATSMKVHQKSKKIQRYSVSGFIENAVDDRFTGNINLLVIIDIDNKTFQIKPILNGSDIDIDYDINAEITSIESNGYNNYEYNKVVKADMPRKNMEFYLKLTLNYPETAYEYLDKEYREKRFGSVEKYCKYIDTNREEIRNVQLDRYQIQVNDNETQYVCVDKDENYYIFKETAVRKFALILDTHTVDIPEFIQKYNNANEQQKVVMNIEKIIEALNMKDYSYVYQKLAKTFKENYFPNEEDFIKYANVVFVNKNMVNYGKFTAEGENYIYDVTLTDKKKKSIRIIDKQFIMQLKDGTDFVCSFSTGDDKLIDDSSNSENP